MTCLKILSLHEALTFVRAFLYVVIKNRGGVVSMTDQDYMKLAIELAYQAAGQTSPNPLVGAVVVKDGHIVGMGAHLKAGEKHAEVHAIEMAGNKAEGSTVYVTLEPCSHYGKTPPCADLLVRSKVKKVFVAVTDPNPLVSGNGIKKLEDAGIEVEVGLLEEEATKLNKYFFHFVQTKTPFVTLKAASSLDGKTATVTGESKWITGEEARKDVHKSRELHDAILVGVNTVIADNPNLTCRVENPKRQPIRIILDTNLRTSLHANVVTDQLAPTWIIVSSQVSKEKMDIFEQRGIKIIQLSNKTIEIEEVLNVLGEHKIMSLYVEGGSTVHGSFIKNNMFNEVIIYLAPKLIGGESAPTSVGGEGFLKMADVPTLQINEYIQLGDDLKIVASKKG